MLLVVVSFCCRSPFDAAGYNDIRPSPQPHQMDTLKKTQMQINKKKLEKAKKELVFQQFFLSPPPFGHKQNFHGEDDDG